MLVLEERDKIIDMLMSPDIESIMLGFSMLRPYFESKDKQEKIEFFKELRDLVAFFRVSPWTFIPFIKLRLQDLLESINGNRRYKPYTWVWILK